MPEHRTPGVHTDEKSIQSRTIGDLSTSVAGFVGPAGSGPIERAHAVTSVAEYARAYGDGRPLAFGGGATTPDFLWRAVHAFFAEGGTRVYIVRTQNLGGRPTAAEYEVALQALEKALDVSIVAAPGSTYAVVGAHVNAAPADAIGNLLIRHAERMRYRIAVLDSVDGLDLNGVRAQRGRIESPYAAFYYPWVRARDPLTKGQILLPPSGFVAGIYARVDADRGVSKAPADEVVRLAVGLERTLDAAEQESLKTAGINCFRVISGQGVVLLGARTTSADPEWKYVNVRRYFTFLEHSIERGLQWAVFEPNRDTLWSNVRRTVEDFLSAQWRSGALIGNTPEQAYWVRCDRSTMTQQDLDNGRLICLIGVAPVKPAEFVNLRIGLWTADHQTDP
jgi:phage tail sheath protein FI